MRNVRIAFREHRWIIHPNSKADLRATIKQAIFEKVIPAYQHASEPIDTIRPDNYLSFHTANKVIVDAYPNTTQPSIEYFHGTVAPEDTLPLIKAGKKLTGFDFLFESDFRGWRRSFDEVAGAIKLLDEFDVCYRIKYSGSRSLHLMIPFEAFPERFRGELVLSQWEEIRNKLVDFFGRNCGMTEIDNPPPGIGNRHRMAYTLHQDTGLVSVPITSAELPYFRPWEAHIHNVTVDKPWHGNIFAGAYRKTLNFLREVEKVSKPKKRFTSG